MVCLVVWAAWEEWVEWECNTIPVQNTLRTRVKQIRNPQKEISGGFFYFTKLPSLNLPTSLLPSAKVKVPCP